MPYDGSGLNLSGRTFAHQDLTGATFRGSTLSNADFTGATLTGAVFDRARLHYTVFFQADLTEASFAHATFDHTDLTQTRLTGTSFAGSDVTGAVFSMPARFSDDPARPTAFIGATILLSTLGLDWARLDLSGATIVGLNAQNDLSGLFAQHTILGTLDLSNKLLANADFDRARLIGTNFAGAQLASALFPRAVCTGANFTGAALSGCDFTGADLTDAVLDGAMLDRADLTQATLAGVSAHGAQFGGLTRAFDLPLEIEAALRKGGTVDKLASLFLQNGRPLSAAPVPQMQSGLWTAGDPGGASSTVQLWTDAGGSQTLMVFAAQPFTLSPDDVAILNDGRVDALRQPFAAHGVTLSPAATIAAGAVASWTLADPSGDYTIRLGLNGDGRPQLRVFTASVAAALHGAYMPQAQLTDANLFGVSARNLQVYGDKAHLDGAILEAADLDGANLGKMYLKQAHLLGVNLARACLINAHLDGAILTASSSGVRAVLSDASLQGAVFTDAQLFAADLSGAAVAVDIERTSPPRGGVWLLELPDVSAELHAATHKVSLASSADYASFAAMQDAFDAGDVSAVGRAMQLKGLSLSTAAAIAPRSTQEIQMVWRLISGGAALYSVSSDVDSNGQWELFAHASRGGEPFGLNPDGDPARFFAIQRALTAGDAATVAKAFAALGKPLPSPLLIAASTQCLAWQISDAPVGYNAWSGLDGDAIRHIYVRPALPTLAQAFETAGLTLRDQATVTATGRSLWDLDNDHMNPLNFTRGYVRFTCVGGADGVHVYGTLMQIERLTDGGRLEIVPENVKTTVLTEANLSADTICPNGRKVSTNRTYGTPWREWMRAPSAPAPPRCVPSDLVFCPQFPSRPRA